MKEKNYSTTLLKLLYELKYKPNLLLKNPVVLDKRVRELKKDEHRIWHNKLMDYKENQMTHLKNLSKQIKNNN